MEKVPEHGYPIEGLWISGIQRKLSADNLAFPLKLASSIWKARKIVKRFRPDVVIGVGGYASGPLLYAAASMDIPCLIQEQNSYAGLTNKWLASKATTICVAYDGMEKFFPANKIVVTGNPVRSDISDLKAKIEKAKSFFNLDAHKPTLLIIGGSLGARTINQAVFAGLDQLEAAGFQWIWQTGRFYYPDILKQLQQSGKDTNQVFEFVREMDLAYAASDIIISRAGALSISELCLVGKPVVFVPSPNVAEDHQTKNAMALVSKAAARMVTDRQAPQDLINTVLELWSKEEERAQLGINIATLAMPKATEKIVKEVTKLIK